MKTKRTIQQNKVVNFFYWKEYALATRDESVFRPIWFAKPVAWFTAFFCQLHFYCFAGADNKILLWNIEAGDCIFEMRLPDIPFSLSWNYDGSLVACTCKDKKLRVIDIRKEEFIQVCFIYLFPTLLCLLSFSETKNGCMYCLLYYATINMLAFNILYYSLAWYIM